MSSPTSSNNEMQARQPLVSVCIPAYNCKQYVTETIASVLRQNYPRLEIIVQDNASTDGTWQLLGELANSFPQLSIARNESNVGMAPNWNLAVGRATGDYVMLLSADDLLEPGFLSTCLDAFARSKADVVTTNHFMLKGEEKRLRKLKVDEKNHVGFPAMVLLRNPFSINFTLFSRQAFERLCMQNNLFAVKLYSCDYDLWIRSALDGVVVHYLDSPLGTYRVHDSNLSRQVTRMYRHATLVLLRHRKELRHRCNLPFRFTMLRFVYRNVLHFIKTGTFDRRHTRILWSEFWR